MRHAHRWDALPKGLLSPGVRTVDQNNPSKPCVGPSIRLRASAALQLLLFAMNQRVREAAADALEPPFWIEQPRDIPTGERATEFP